MSIYVNIDEALLKKLKLDEQRFKCSEDANEKSRSQYKNQSDA